MAGEQETDGVDGSALGLLPHGNAQVARHGALQLRHQPDVDLRSRERAYRLRLPHRAEELLAARGPGLSSWRLHRHPDWIRDELRSLSAGVRAQHADELSERPAPDH